VPCGAKRAGIVDEIAASAGSFGNQKRV